MSPFNWRGPSQSGLCDAPPLVEMRPQNAYYWRKKAGLTGSRVAPVRGWRKTKPADSANCERASNHGN